MDKLPAEVLCDIFLKALPSERGGHEFPNALTLTQLYISHVCQRWRDLSLSFGELWSHLQLDLRYKYVNEAGRYTWKCRKEVFDTWLLRSKGSPLNYTLYGIFPESRYPLTDSQRDVERVIVALVSEQHRWKHIRIRVSNLTVSPDFPGIILVNMPVLISLEISVSSYTLRVTAPFTISLARSPRLKRLLIGGHFDLDVGSAPVNNTLTEVQLLYERYTDPQMPQNCLDLLRNAPFLTELLAILFPFASRTMFNPLNGDRVLLSKLRTLELRPRPLFKIIDKLTLPSLESLTFGKVAGEIAAPILRNFLDRSRPPLTSLHIVLGDADSLIPSLELLPALKFLQICYSKVSEHFFRKLVIPVNACGLHSDRLQCILCPSLVYLDFANLEIRGDREACIDAIFYMIQSRAEVLGTFKTIEYRLIRRSDVKLAINGEDWSIDKFRTLLRESRTMAVKSCM